MFHLLTTTSFKQKNQIEQTRVAKIKIDQVLSQLNLKEFDVEDETDAGTDGGIRTEF